MLVILSRALNDGRLNESRCKCWPLSIGYSGHACPPGRSLDIEFQIPPPIIGALFVLVVGNEARRAAIGSPPLKYVVCGDVKVRDECVAYVIPT